MSSISKFYSGSSVLLTGGTGFIGKQIVEKLLRSCSEIDRIYLLMRAKKDQTPEERLQQTLSAPVFERLRSVQPEFQRKLVPVLGDVGVDRLGISDADRQRLQSDVSVVIHSAATLNFMEPLRDAVNMNVLGVKRVLALCKEMSNLQALVHISTAYTQVNRKDIGEQTYEPPIAPERLIDMTTTLTDDELAVLTPQLLQWHSRPNTYTFTKAVAENLVEQEQQNIPCAIVRPSIVGATFGEPFEGWIETFTGFTGVCAGIGTGFMRCMLTGPKINIDIVPVDVTANAIIAAAWNRATSSADKDGKDLHIYNVSNSEDNRYCMRKLISNAARFGNKHPFRKSPTKCTIMWTESRRLNEFFARYIMIPRSLAMDAVLRLRGKRPRAMKALEQSDKLQKVLEFFTTNEWYFSTGHMRKLRERMSETDRQEFNFSIKELDWDDYLEKYWLGVKQYLLKDPKPTATGTAQAVTGSSRPSSATALNSLPTRSV